jgi:protein ImuB
MLWLCIHLPYLPLEALAPPKDQAVAVFVKENNRRRMVACNAKAASAGIAIGTEATTALAIAPQLQIIERNPKAELAALQRLAAWGYQWSSRVSWQTAAPDLQAGPHRYASMLWLEIGASGNLFGGYLSLLAKLETSFKALHYRFQLGVAPTLEGAALLARAGRRVLLQSAPQLINALRKLPVDLLAIPNEVRYALQRSGIVSIGMLLALPSTGLARRFEKQVTGYLDRLCGREPDQRPVYRPPKQYRARCDFGAAIHSIEALLFPLRRMLHELAGYLRALDLAIQHYTLVFEHERSVETRLAVGLAGPSRDAERLFALTKERLHTLTLQADVYGLRIEAATFVEPAVRQHGLFGGAQVLADELAQTLEKITARLGPDSVRILQTVADHRPELAWRFGRAAQDATPAAPRPLWLLSEPKPLPAPPAIDPQFERISSGWWSVAVNRDYYVAHIKGGIRSWVFFNHQDQQWYLQGYWG